MSCDLTRERLADFAAGGLTAEETEQISLHLKTCPDCRRELATQERLLAGMKMFYEELQPGSGRSIDLSFLTEAAPETSNQETVGWWNQMRMLLETWLSTPRLVTLGAALTIVLLMVLAYPQIGTHRPVGSPAKLHRGRAIALGSRGSVISGDRFLKEAVAYQALDALRISFPRQAEIEMQRGTIFQVSRGGCSIDTGSADFAILPRNKAFGIVTPQGSIAVLGTRFRLTVSEKQTQIILLSGSLLLQPAAANGATHLVHEPGTWLMTTHQVVFDRPHPASALPMASPTGILRLHPPQPRSGEASSTVTRPGRPRPVPDPAPTIRSAPAAPASSSILLPPSGSESGQESAAELFTHD